MGTLAKPGRAGQGRGLSAGRLDGGASAAGRRSARPPCACQPWGAGRNPGLISYGFKFNRGIPGARGGIAGLRAAERRPGPGRGVWLQLSVRVTLRLRLRLGVTDRPGSLAACRAAAPGPGPGRSNSLGFPKPAGPRPETRLAGYKRKRAINRTFQVPSQFSHDAAASPLAAAAPPEGRTMGLRLIQARRLRF